MDSKYEPQDLSRIAKEQVHLTKEQRESLAKLLTKSIKTSSKASWENGRTKKFRWSSSQMRCHTIFKRPIRIPHVHMETLRKEVQRLVDIGVLEEVDGSTAGPWCAPSFITRKKDGRVRFITDYREANKCIRRKPWPMPHITVMIQDIGSYTYVTALDLSMGYYHFRLNDETSELSTFMLPFGLYKYRRLPMGLSISPDLFQE